MAGAAGAEQPSPSRPVPPLQPAVDSAPASRRLAYDRPCRDRRHGASHGRCRCVHHVWLSSRRVLPLPVRDVLRASGRYDISVADSRSSGRFISSRHYGELLQRVVANAVAKYDPARGHARRTRPAAAASKVEAGEGSPVSEHRSRNAAATAAGLVPAGGPIATDRAKLSLFRRRLQCRCVAGGSSAKGHPRTRPPAIGTALVWPNPETGEQDEQTIDVAPECVRFFCERYGKLRSHAAAARSP